MECDDLAELLTDLLEGDVEPAVEEAALAHLASCEECERVLAGTRSVIDLAREHGRVDLEPEDRQRMFRALDTQSEEPS